MVVSCITRGKSQAFRAVTQKPGLSLVAPNGAALTALTLLQCRRVRPRLYPPLWKQSVSYHCHKVMKKGILRLYSGRWSLTGALLDGLGVTVRGEEDRTAPQLVRSWAGVLMSTVLRGEKEPLRVMLEQRPVTLF